jgi:hypothetical protein
MRAARWLMAAQTRSLPRPMVKVWVLLLVGFCLVYKTGSKWLGWGI